MVDQTDDQIPVAMVADTEGKYNGLLCCCFDEGFHNPKNQQDLKPLLEQVVLPREGRLTVKAKQIENSEDFVHACRQHAAVESASKALENHGLDRYPDHGLHGFSRYVGLAVLSRNIQKLCAALQEQTTKRIKRRKKAAERSFRSAA